MVNSIERNGTCIELTICSIIFATSKNGVNTFVDKLLVDLEVDREQCEYWLNRSVGIVTALLPHLGYETASSLAKEAYTTGRAIRDIILEKVC